MMKLMSFYTKKTNKYYVVKFKGRYIHHEFRVDGRYKMNHSIYTFIMENNAKEFIRRTTRSFNKLFIGESNKQITNRDFSIVKMKGEKVGAIDKKINEDKNSVKAIDYRKGHGEKDVKRLMKGGKND